MNSLRAKWVVMVSASVGVLIYGLLRPYMHDDSVNLLMAEEVSKGHNPYEYFDNKPPGLYLVLALGIQLFGHPDIIGRVFAWGSSLLIGLFAAWSLEKKASRSTQMAMGMGVCLAVWLAGGFLPLADVAMTLHVSLGFLILSRGEPSVGRMIAVGIVLAFAMQFKQTALAVILAVGGGLLCQFIGRQMSFGRMVGLGMSHVLGVVGAMAVIWWGYSQAGLAEVIWERCFKGLSESFERRHALSSALLLVIRAGWFVFPAVLFIVFRLWRGQFFKDRYLFQVAAIGALILLYPLTKRFYAHYVMASIPLFFFVLHAAWRSRGKDVGRVLTPRRVVAASGIGLLLLGVGAFLKRESFEKTFVHSQREDAREMAHELGRWMENEDDRALLLERGPNGLKPSAIYFYSGLRPPIGLLFFHSIPLAEVHREVARLPEVLAESRVRLVTFNPKHGYHPYYYPLGEEARSRVESALQTHFVKLDSSIPHLWVRKGLEQSKQSRVYRGPFANQRN